MKAQEPAPQEESAPPAEYITASEAAALLHVSAKTVSRWAKEGKIPHMLTLGGHRRFPKEAIEQLVQRLVA